MLMINDNPIQLKNLTLVRKFLDFPESLIHSMQTKKRIHVMQQNDHGKHQNKYCAVFSSHLC